MIDLHFHVLPGIDDGPKTMSESIELARAAAAVGVSTLVATPHVSWPYPNDPDTIACLVDELAAQLAGEGVALELRSGAELAITYIDQIEPAQLSRLCLGDGRWLLVEPPFTPTSAALEEILRDVQRRGYGIVIAHPERCQTFHQNPRMLAALVRDGALTSITAGSLVGRFGSAPRRFALKLLREGLVHNVASDAHDLGARAPGIATELERAGVAPLTEWLTREVPEAVLGGTQIPAPPHLHPVRTRRRWRLHR